MRCFSFFTLDHRLRPPLGGERAAARTVFRQPPHHRAVRRPLYSFDGTCDIVPTKHHPIFPHFLPVDPPSHPLTPPPYNYSKSQWMSGLALLASGLLVWSLVLNVVYGNEFYDSLFTFLGLLLLSSALCLRALHMRRRRLEKEEGRVGGWNSQPKRRRVSLVLACAGGCEEERKEGGRKRWRGEGSWCSTLGGLVGCVATRRRTERRRDRGRGRARRPR